MVMKHKRLNFQFAYSCINLFVNRKLLSYYFNLQREELYYFNTKSPQKVFVQSIINNATIFSKIFI